MPEGRDPGRTRPLCRLFRGAYRAGRHAGGDRAAHRHRRGDHRQLELLGHNHRPAEPRRHDRNASPQGRRRRAGAARRAHPRPLRRDRRGRFAHGVDDRAHPDRPERAEHRPRTRRDAGAVPRHRHRNPGALRARAERAGRRFGPRRTLRIRYRADLEKRAGPHGFRDFSAKSRRRPSVTRRVCICVCRAAPATTRRSWPASMRSAMLFVPSIDGISHHWSEDTSDTDIMLGAPVLPTPPPRSCGPRSLGRAGGDGVQVKLSFPRKRKSRATASSRAPGPRFRGGDGRSFVYPDRAQQLWNA